MYSNYCMLKLKVVNYACQLFFGHLYKKIMKFDFFHVSVSLDFGLF